MPLFLEDKTNVLRHLGYGVLGLAAQNGLVFGNRAMRFSRPDGQLLYELNMLAPNEESRLTGRATGSVTFTGLPPKPGDSVTVTITSSLFSGGFLSKTVTAPTPLLGQNGWALTDFAYNLASAFLTDTQFINNVFGAVADYGKPPFTYMPALPVVSFLAPPGGSFVLSASFTGSTAPQISKVAQPLAPFIKTSCGANQSTLYGYLPILDFLEGTYGAAYGGLGIISTAAGDFNPAQELDLRNQQYHQYQLKMSEFLKIPICRDNVNPGQCLTLEG